ncbi:MAG: serine/threonine-protein phosphatase [Leptospiraceae bacterium]|nr:serine/threonine-protein phosphatase [Leptospiraceae bacterium]MDW7976373.1 PP2C family protein-serine/threonine phosphatase [Leptospiraceae bacterium]
MKSYWNVFVIYFASLIFFIFLYYKFFHHEFYREPFFYFHDNKIYYSEKEYLNLNLQIIEFLQEIEPNKLLLITNHQSLVVDKVAYNFEKFIKTFYVPIILSLILLFYGIWFYENLQDFFFSLFFFLQSIFLFLSLLTLYYPEVFFYFLLWNIVTILTVISYININIRFLGKSINTFILLIEAIIFFFFSLLLLLQDVPIRPSDLLNLYQNSFFIAFFVFLVVNIIRLFQKNLDRIEKLKILSFLFGNIFGALPLVLFLNLKSVNVVIYLFLYFLYPSLITYSLYRMYILPTQVIITKTFVFGVFSLFFVLFYFLLIYHYNASFPGHLEKYRILYDLIFLAFLVLAIEPLRERVYLFFRKKFLIPEKKYIDSLMRLSNILSRIYRPVLALELFLKEVQKTLEIDRCFFLFPDSYIPSMKIESKYVLSLPSSNVIWSYVQPEKMMATTYIVYSTGNRKQLFDFLYQNQILLMVGLGERPNLTEFIRQKALLIVSKFYKIFKREELEIYQKLLSHQIPKAAILFGFPKDRNKFLLKELRYVQEVSRLASLLLKNIYNLFLEVEKRKKIRYVLHSGKFQRKLSVHTKNYPNGVSIHYVNQPALSVSGDYIDILSLDSNRIAVFLGDVSGHGLGTGYLVSAIRSIVHYVMKNQQSLRDTINCINLFLSERYKGYEFFTLSAFILDVPKGKIEFINAAHSGILIKPPNGDIVKLEKTQRILGLNPMGYETYFYNIKPKTKIFLCSDGVYETLDENGEFFGEERFLEFIKNNHHLPLIEITKKLLDELNAFRNSKTPQDDTSFLVLEYDPPRTFLETILEKVLPKSYEK